MPSTPVGPLEVKDIRKDSVTLTWGTPESDGGCPITGYVIEKQDKRGKWEPVERVGRDTREVKVNDLKEGDKHIFRVKAENKKGLSEPLKQDKHVETKSLHGRW